MIVKPQEMNFSNKKFTMLIYGSPGIGKSTLALSAPDPVIIDFDKGMSRVKPKHRALTIECNSYDDVLIDIRSPEVADCQTIIIDTGGSFVTYLQEWAMRQAPQNRQKNGAISLKGFGVVKTEFKRFTENIRLNMNKNLIYVFHSEEQKDKDGNPQQRLMCEGAARNLVWQNADFGAYLQMLNGKRVISFAPTDEYFAKGCHGIEGQYEVPTLGANDRNNFLTQIFDMAKATIEQENEAFAFENEAYETVIAEAKEIIAAVTNADEATEAAETLKGLDHVLTSRKEASVLLSARANELSLKWDKAGRRYTLAGVI